MSLRVALVGGPMYDRLDRLFDDEDVEVVVRADHPTLNRAVAELLAAGERIDLLSTHSKYAPSQRWWLHPLDALVGLEVCSQLAPEAVRLCRFDGALLCLPRSIDVRVLWVRSDRVLQPPETWDDVVAGSFVLGFPGRESGLFGTFFELVVGQGGRLFDEDLAPTLDTEEARRAVRVLCELAARAPADLPDWHYDDVDRALLEGRIDAAAAWPGAADAIRSSALADLLSPHPYPAGSTRRVSYAGCHAWAIPTTAGDVDGAVALLRRLSGREAAALDASGGTVPAHVGALAAIRPRDEVDTRRLALTRDAIESAMITYPPLERFPALEDACWQVLNLALRGAVPHAEVAPLLQRVAVAALG